MWRPSRDQQGWVTLELVMLGPALGALLGALYLGARVETSKMVVAQAAQAAARAGARARTPGAEQAAGLQAARLDLAGHVVCATMAISLSGQLAPGTVIHAQVSCTTGYGILPGTYTAAASAADVVPPYFEVGS